MVSAGVAGVASNVTAGWFIDRAGIDILYLACGIGSLALGALAWLILPGVEHQRRDSRNVVIPGDTLA